GRAGAIYWSGALVSPLLQLVALFVLYFGTRRIFGRDWAFLCSILFIIQPSVSQAFIAGRPDHHAAQHFLTILSVVLTFHLLRRPFNRPLCLVLGGVFALALWTAVETILVVFGCLAGLGLAWLLWSRDFAIKGLYVSVSATVAGFTALFLERGAAGFSRSAIELDRYSMFHALWFALLLGFWAALFLWERRRDSAPSVSARAVVASLCGAVAVSALWAVFPPFFSGDWFPVDPVFLNTHKIFISEGQPVVSWGLYEKAGLWLSLNRFFHWFGFLLPGSLFLLFLLWRREDQDWPVWLFVGLTLFVVTAFAVSARNVALRSIPVMELLVLFPYAEMVARVYRRLACLPSVWGAATRSAVLLALAAWPLLFSGEVGPRRAGPEAGPEAGKDAAESCPISELAEHLGNSEAWRSTPKRIMAHADYGPEIMFRTPHAVFSIPIHRQQPGYTMTYRALTAETGSVAREILMQSEVDLIVICRAGPIARLFRRGAYETNPDLPTFSEQLLEGRIPSWLEPVELPGSLSESFLVLTVTRDKKA
ncbi:MAG: hypothetical protein OEM59_17085, partial [Rhodospirillales bacterium]|nr:hypothetical protein [Rhodospirillales bacterium]